MPDDDETRLAQQWHFIEAVQRDAEAATLHVPQWVAPIQQIVETYERQADAVADVMRPLQEFAETYDRQFGAVVEAIRTAEMAAQAAAEWVVSHQEQLRATLLWLENWPRQWGDTLREYGRICTQAGWPPTLRLPLPVIADLVGRKREGATPDAMSAALEQAWLACFTDEEVSRIVSQWWVWPEVMDVRRPLLEDALEAHRQGRFALSVPVFVAQIEGVLAATFAHAGQLRGHGVHNKNSPGASFLEILASRSNDVIEKTCIVSYSVDVLFGQFEHGRPWRGLNRHAILHGADTTYATRVRSLQAILALDRVVDALGYIATDDGFVHRPGCNKLRGLPANTIRRVYRNGDDAAGAGLVPCPHCHGGPSDLQQPP